MNVINQFQGKYRFLSNFYNSLVKYDGLVFLNNEAAFQAMKTLNLNIRKSFCHLNPSQAKSKGRKVILRNDWEEVKDDIMYEIVYNKFTQNLELKEKLLATKDLILIEGNTWNDCYWGICRNEGKNKLGKILMKVREEIK